MPDLSDLAQQIAVWAIPVLLAITVHEAAHGYAARHFGDDTAERAGRLTLNPLRHVDPLGTVIVPALLLWLGGFLFGWAKPVPVNFSRLRSPRRDMALVAGAGPASNLVMALGWAALLSTYFYGMGAPDGGWTLLRDMASAGIAINIILMVLNLLPLPPLDGGRIAVGVLPRALAAPLARVEPWGFVILVALLASGLLGRMLAVPYALVRDLIAALFGLN